MIINNPSKEQIPSLRALWKEAFGDTDEFLDSFFGTAFSPDRAVCIEENNKILSALYIFDCLFEDKKIAYIYAVATSKQARGRGLCRKLLDYTHKLLKTQGYIGAILVPSDKGLFEMYEKLGYKTCCFTGEFEVLAQGCPVEINEIDKVEFAKLRREFLPEKPVIQEGENLDFLESFAKFYTGKDFLLASFEAEGTLIATEFLGNKEKASSIVCTLGLNKGKFRTQGMSRPFGMYYDFSEGTHPTPEYFGLAFD